MNNSGPTHKAGNYKKFLDSGMAAYICQKADNDKYRYHWYNNDSAIHKERSQTECVYVSDDRIKKNVIFNTLVQEGKFILVNEKYNKYQNDFYWGTEIRFEYNGKQYSWNGDGKIYKIIDNRHEEVCSAWDDRNPLIQALEK